MVSCRSHKRGGQSVRRILAAAIFFAAVSAGSLFAQSPEPFAGTLLASEQEQATGGAGEGAPNGAAGSATGGAYGDTTSGQLRRLRDLVYNNAAPDEVSRLAATLIKMAQGLSSPAERLVTQSKIEYLSGRSWQEHGDNKKAIEYFEAALKHAEQAGDITQTAEALFAGTKALSQLVLLKGMPYLLANGPKISPNAKKVLAMEPGHPGAQIMLASSKAYPPAAFGGAPKEAIKQMQDLLKSHQNGFEKDILFDIRTCLGTAYSKLGDTVSASFWFRKALGLYPRNDYAKTELEKLAK